MTEQELRIEIALIFYQRRSISLGKAAEVAGISKTDFQQIMASRKIPVNYDLDAWKEDKTSIDSF